MPYLLHFPHMADFIPVFSGIMAQTPSSRDG
jgi:hypothetical protein